MILITISLFIFFKIVKAMAIKIILAHFGVIPTTLPKDSHLNFWKISQISTISIELSR